MLKFKRIKQALFSQVDIASLVYFRILFGAIMMWEVWRYFSNGWIHRYYIDPTFFFTYWGFGWITPWPGDGMFIHFIVLGALAFFIMLGLFYRASTILFFLGFTYVFLLDQANYLNHFYLISLVSFLMIFVPAHRAFSLDALRKPSIRSNTAPAWTLWLLMFQIGISYFYAGFAKLNWDWLHGEPMHTWLTNRAHYPVLGQWFTEKWMAYLFSYGGLFFNLLIVPALLWKRTRIFALVGAVLFHLTNAWLFQIGIFPWFMIGATMMFLPPSWPRRWIPRYKRTKKWKISEKKKKIIVALLLVYVLFQLLVPLRHFLYPGNVSWTEEGHLFSWHMKLRDKDSSARFFVTDPETNESWELHPDDYLTSRQRRKMPSRPVMILQFAHHLADEMRKDGYEDVKIRAKVKSSLNQGPTGLLIDPNADLTKKKRSFLPADWISRSPDEYLDNNKPDVE